MAGMHSPSLTLVHMVSDVRLVSGKVKSRQRHLSIFRHWIEQMTLSMAALEARLAYCHEVRAHCRFRQLRRRFIRVQNEAYLCCVTMESRASEIRRERAAYRIPRLMWMMIQIRGAAEAALR